MGGATIWSIMVGGALAWQDSWIATIQRIASELTLGSFAYIFAALLLFALRDMLFLLWLNFTGKMRGHADLSGLVVLAIAYGPLPMLLMGAGAWQFLPAAWPLATSLIGLAWPAAEVVVMWFLLMTRAGARRPGSKSSPTIARNRRSARASSLPLPRNGGGGVRSFRIVKDDAERVAPAGAQPADAVAHGDAVDAARALHRALVHRRRSRASPWRSGTTSARDCMRGRCSVSTNSPPVKSRPARTAGSPTCSGKASSP